MLLRQLVSTKTCIFLNAKLPVSVKFYSSCNEGGVVGVGLAINRSRVKFIQTLCPVRKQYNLVNGWWRFATGKVTVGLASHLSCVRCVTDLSGLTTYEFKAWKKEMSSPPVHAPLGVCHPLPLPFTSSSNRSQQMHTRCVDITRVLILIRLFTPWAIKKS